MLQCRQWDCVLCCSGGQCFAECVAVLLVGWLRCHECCSVASGLDYNGLRCSREQCVAECVVVLLVCVAVFL